MGNIQPFVPGSSFFVLMKSQNQNNLVPPIRVFATLTSSKDVTCNNSNLEVLVLIPTLAVKGAAGWKTTPRLSTKTRTPDFMKLVGF